AAQDVAQRAQRLRPDARAVGERGGAREERADLRGGQTREDRTPARGEVRGEPDVDVGHERGAARRALLDEVEHLATVEDGEVRALARRLDEARDDGPREPGERRLPRVRGPEGERGRPEPVPV